MEKDESKIWAQLFGKKVCTEKLNIEGFKKPIEFDIYDGFAICNNYRGHTFHMEYPQMKVVKESEEISNEIIKNVGGIECADEITVLHILIAFNTLHKDGVEVIPKKAN